MSRSILTDIRCSTETQTEPPKTRRVPPYHVILLNDDDHSMEFVIDVLRKVLAIKLEVAMQLMMEALTKGRAKVIVVRIHEVGEPAPQESWLRVHARLIDESRRENARLSAFRPRSGERFVWGPEAGGR